MAIDRRWLIGGGAVLLGGGALILYKRHQANAANSTASSNPYGAPLPGSGIIEVITPPGGQGPPGKPGPPGPAAKPKPKPKPKPKVPPPKLKKPPPHLPNPRRPPVPTAPKPRTYTVVKGDTLTEIGEKFGESWQTLYAKNKKVVGPNPNLIYPGEVLQV